MAQAHGATYTHGDTPHVRPAPAPRQPGREGKVRAHTLKGAGMESVTRALSSATNNWMRILCRSFREWKLLCFDAAPRRPRSEGSPAKE
eukprot:8116384-Alexandrium_andersonii.AAC.1